MKPKQRIWLLLAFLGTAGMIVWMRKQGAPLTIPGITPKGIVDLEFAWNQEKLEVVKQAWSGNLYTVALNNIYIDFLFIIAYTAFLTLSCKWMAAKHTGNLSAVGEKIARIVPAAGTFDVAENALMLLSLQATPNNYTTLITAVFAGFKFLIIIVTLLYLLVALPALLLRRG